MKFSLILRRKLYSLINHLNHQIITNKNVVKLVLFIFRQISSIFFPIVKSLKSRHNILFKLVSEKYKFIYLENPLAASRSVIAFFITNSSDNFNVQKIYTDTEELFDKNVKYNSYIKFSIIRNPWSRLVSCYNKKILNANTLAKIIQISPYKGLFPQMSFENFVIWLCSKEGRDENADPHWISQNRILHDRNGKPFYNMLIKLENIKVEFKNLLHDLNLQSVDFPHSHKSESRYIKPLYETWTKYYRNLDRRIIKKIEDRYKMDAIIFNYPKLTSIIE